MHRSFRPSRQLSAGVVRQRPARQRRGLATLLALLLMLGASHARRPENGSSRLVGEGPRTTLAAPEQFWFPFLKGDTTSFSGYALTNFGPLSAQVEFEALAPGGTLQPYPRNPSIFQLDAQKQMARTASEIFDLPVTQSREGWVRLLSDQAEIASFFQFGMLASGGFVTQLDGAVAIQELSSELFFTRVFDGPLAFPSFEGGEDAVTTLYLANPGSQPVDLQFQIFDPAGQPVSVANRRIASAGCLAVTISSLFNLGPISDGYVRVTSNGAGVAGFQTVELEGTIMGLNGVMPGTALVTYSAQLAHGQNGSNRIFTSVRLVNASESPLAVTLTAVNEDGSVLNVAQNIVLGPRQALQRDAGELFSLGPSTSPQVDGSIRVDASGPGLIGDVIFGDPDEGRYSAALPLQARLLRRALFSQVANLDEGNERQRFFTGLAVHNPNSINAQVTIRVFTEDCREAGVAILNLAPGARRSDLVANFVPGSAGQARGYIVIDSTQPIVAQQLFGNFALDFLSAVPPNVLQE